MHLVTGSTVQLALMKNDDVGVFYKFTDLLPATKITALNLHAVLVQHNSGLLILAQSSDIFHKKTCILSIRVTLNMHILLSWS